MAVIDRPAAAPPARTRRRWRDWTLAVPPAVTLLVMLWGLTGPSYWDDESATLSAEARTVPQLWRMLGTVDAVHGLYYFMLWPVVHLWGSREYQTRLPSALAMAAAAFGIAVIGRRLRSRRTGLYAGLAFAVMPMISIEGHNARPYAFETAAAVLASYLLIRAAQDPRPRSFALYGCSLVLLGYLQMYGLLIIVAHAVTLVPAARLPRAPARSPSLTAGRLMLRWLASVAAACVVLGPVLYMGWRQRGGLGWLRQPTWGSLPALPSHLVGSTPALVGLVVLAVIGVLRADGADWPARKGTGQSGGGRATETGSGSGRATDTPSGSGRAAGTRSGGGRATGTRSGIGSWVSPDRASRRAHLVNWLALPWLLLPPTCLILASVIFIPTYEASYVTFCLPGLALLAGAGLAALAQPLRLAVLLIVAAIAVPAQLVVRQTNWNSWLRTASNVLVRHERPGDAVYYLGAVPAWNITYPAGFGHLRDISVGETAGQAGRLVGPEAPMPVINQRLRSVQRLWIIEEHRWHNPPATLNLYPGFRFAGEWSAGDFHMKLYVRADRPQT